MAFVPLEKLSKLQDGYRRSFRVQGHHLLLIVEGNKRFLLENRCPHMGKPLDSATIGTDDCVIRCPHHGLQFDLSSGEVVTQQANCKPLTLYRLSYDGTVAGVEL